MSIVNVSLTMAKIRKAQAIMERNRLTQKRDLEPETKRQWQDILGKEIGRGMSRIVYQHKYRPDLVVKFEYSCGHFQNIMEREMWRQVAFMFQVNKWFAQVHHISDDGTYLIQSKTKRISQKDLPTSVPGCFTDMKRRNWGTIDGHPCCHDYGLCLFTIRTRLKKAQFF